MCTVTYIPINGGAILTSNRDERKDRPLASFPTIEKLDDQKLFYPKDGLAGGTWMIVSNKGKVGVLLNGARTPHPPKPSYKHSRGLILPQLFRSNNPLTALKDYSFLGIEPFTMILWQDDKLYQIFWDGEISLDIEEMNPNIPHIWSSCTLYTQAMHQEKRSWFAEFWQTIEPSTLDQVLDFHLFHHQKNSDYSIVLNRPDGMLTVSVTAIEVKPHSIKMFYKDMVTDAEQTLFIEKIN